MRESKKWIKVRKDTARATKISHIAVANGFHWELSDGWIYYYHNLCAEEDLSAIVGLEIFISLLWTTSIRIS